MQMPESKALHEGHEEGTKATKENLKSLRTAKFRFEWEALSVLFSALFVSFVSCFRAFRVFICVDLRSSAVRERLSMQSLLQ